MRNQQPSPQWMQKWEKEFVSNGGHNGQATIKALSERAREYYRAGATPKVAGMATAKEYQQYSTIQLYK